MQDKTKRLWDQEINVVAGGLDEDQVVEFVGELTAKYRDLLEKQVHYVSLGTLSEKTAAEADKLAIDIKARAKQEAEAEAKNIVDNASQKAQEMLATAKKEAQELNRREVDRIIEGANRKASYIDTEAKQRAQLYLIRARALIEEDLKGRFRSNYEQLLTGLRELISEGHDIEAAWKGKLAELWKKETLELEGFEAMPALLAAEMAKAASLAGVELDSKNEVPTEIPKEENIGSGEIINESSVAPPVAEEMVDPVPETMEAVVEENVVPTPETIVPIAEVLGMVSETVESIAEEIQVEEVNPQYAMPQGEYLDMYDGEVDLTLVPPIEMATMSKIYDQLQTVPELKILRTVGSRDKGPTITVLLEKEVPLIDMLKQIPGVETASGITDKEIGVMGTKGKGRHKVALITQAG